MRSLKAKSLIRTIISTLIYSARTSLMDCLPIVECSSVSVNIANEGDNVSTFIVRFKRETVLLGRASSRGGPVFKTRPEEGRV